MHRGFGSGPSPECLQALLLAALAAGCATNGSERRSGDASAAPDANGEGRASDAGARTCRLSSEPDFDAGADAAAACADVPVLVFQEDCSGGICHHAGSGQAAHLDLVSPCVADRLVGVVSTCHHEPLVDPNDPDGGFLLEKLRVAKPECGGVSMPYGNHLPPRELACVRGWVAAVVHEAEPR